ncbi:MAG: GNAT family N-acetyltransferase [Peptococcaceae bacterium]|nr:GNAT family N-acetyltransferase [Peptococcaceae bacterium]
MNSRPLDVSENKQGRELWSLCFPEDSDAFKDWFFAEQFPSLRNWALWEEDRLTAIVYAMPYTLVCRGKTIPGSFLLGIGTHPEARHRGLMRRLLDKVHSDLAQTCAAVCLHPSDPNFYRKLGYATVADFLQIRLPMADLDPNEPRGSIETTPDFDRLAAINRAHSESMAFHALRDRTLLARRFADTQTGGGFCIANEQAYAFVDPGTAILDTPETKQRVITLTEFSYTDFAAGRSLLAAIPQAPISVLRIPNPATDPQRPDGELRFSLPVSGPRIPTPGSRIPTSGSRILTPGSCIPTPYLMLYVLDWTTMVSGMPAKAMTAPVFSKTVHITDDNTHWLLTVSEGTTSVSAANPTSLETIDLSLTRDQFTRWICGYSDSEDLISENVVNADQLSFFPKQTSYFFDMY